MIVTKKGHLYFAEHVGGSGTTQIQFLDKENSETIEGVTTQELCRILIDRTSHCDECLPHAVNPAIIQHFRMILALHEARALIRKVEKGELQIEQAVISADGHILISTDGYGANETSHRPTSKTLENGSDATPSYKKGEATITQLRTER